MRSTGKTRAFHPAHLGWAALLGLLFCGCSSRGAQVLRVGYFDNLTHAQALVGIQRGTFREALPGVEIRWKRFNAGPQAVEAMFAGDIDLAYLGPNPALNGYLRSNGAALRVLASACSGGAALVVQPDLDFKGPRSLVGRRLATPQLGNTQDVAARLWLQRAGLNPDGDVLVTPVENPDLPALFQKKAVAGAWTVEPWVSRLVKAGGRVALEESSLWPHGRYLTTVLAASGDLLARHPGWARGFLTAHRQVTAWIRRNPAQARRLVRLQLAKDTGKDVDPALLKSAWSRLDFDANLDPALLVRVAEHAQKLGFWKGALPKVEDVYVLDLPPASR